MKTLTRILSTAAFMLTFSAFVIGQESETRNLEGFEGISVSAGIQAELVKGNTNKIEISAKGIELEKVTTEIKRDVLKIGIDEKWWKNIGGKKNKRDVEVVITYSSTLSSISSSSGSSTTADHTILSKYLELDVSSGAYMDLEIDVDETDIDLSSGSRMILAGNAGEVAVDMSSGANLDAYKLTGQNVSVDGSSGSNAKVTATSSLTADVSSGANVKYKGDPSLNVDKSSGGSVQKSSSM